MTSRYVVGVTLFGLLYVSGEELIFKGLSDEVGSLFEGGASVEIGEASDVGVGEVSVAIGVGNLREEFT